MSSHVAYTMEDRLMMACDMGDVRTIREIFLDDDSVSNLYLNYHEVSDPLLRISGNLIFCPKKAGCTALSIAVRQGYTAVIDVLLEFGVQVDFQAEVRHILCALKIQTALHFSLIFAHYIRMA